MWITYLTLAVLAILLFTIFYVVIRLRDVQKYITALNEKLPLTNEMRRQASDTIANLNERLGSLTHKADQLTHIMNEVVSLRNLFTMPKKAGGAGERLLEKALHDILPSDMYKAQYALSAGTVDFIIRFKDCFVPVDSKLSLENYSRMLAATDEVARKTLWKAFSNDVKKRIEETSKYILPAEKTTDFALMYIPSESVYYEAFIKDKQFGEENTLADHALRRKVYPTSPQTLYPYLMTILQGMKALKIEENAKQILNKVAGLRNDFERFKSIYGIIIDHIADAYKKHNNEAQSALTKLEQHISSLEQRSP